MQTSDDTQPRNPLQGKPIEKFPTQPTGKLLYPEDEDMGGPGCIVWGIVGMLSVLLAGVLVLVSAFAGWNSGVSTARTNATATIASDIQNQCNLAENDAANQNTGLLQARINFLQEQTPAPACLAEIIPTATALYIQSLPTETPTPTLTSTPTETAIPAPTDILEATLTPTEEATVSLYDYDMDGLLAEAQSQISQQQYQAAVDTLDAIIAIDPNFQRTTVESLFFNALTSEATRLFRTGNLQQGIILTGRAEAYGDIQGLNYERFIANLYLSAQRLKITNPAESVRLFSRVAYEQGLSNYLNGQVISELQEAYANYGDTLFEQGNFCAAQEQYNAALSLQPIVTNISRGDITGKRDSASAACTSGVVPTAEDGATDAGTDGTTSQDEVTAAPVPTAKPTIAPVGSSG